LIIKSNRVASQFFIGPLPSHEWLGYYRHRRAAFMPLQGGHVEAQQNLQQCVRSHIEAT